MRLASISFLCVGLAADALRLGDLPAPAACVLKELAAGSLAFSVISAIACRSVSRVRSAQTQGG